MLLTICEWRIRFHIFLFRWKAILEQSKTSATSLRVSVSLNIKSFLDGKKLEANIMFSIFYFFIYTSEPLTLSTEMHFIINHTLLSGIFLRHFKPILSKAVLFLAYLPQWRRRYSFPSVGFQPGNCVLMPSFDESEVTTIISNAVSI